MKKYIIEITVVHIHHAITYSDIDVYQPSCDTSLEKNI